MGESRALPCTWRPGQGLTLPIRAREGQARLKGELGLTPASLTALPVTVRLCPPHVWCTMGKLGLSSCLGHISRVPTMRLSP